MNAALDFQVRRFHFEDIRLVGLDASPLAAHGLFPYVFQNHLVPAIGFLDTREIVDILDSDQAIDIDIERELNRRIGAGSRNQELPVENSRVHHLRFDLVDDAIIVTVNDGDTPAVLFNDPDRRIILLDHQCLVVNVQFVICCGIRCVLNKFIIDSTFRNIFRFSGNGDFGGIVRQRTCYIEFNIGATFQFADYIDFFPIGQNKRILYELQISGNIDIIQGFHTNAVSHNGSPRKAHLRALVYNKAPT